VKVLFSLKGAAMSKAYFSTILLALAGLPAFSSAGVQPEVTPILIGEIIPVFYKDQAADTDKGRATALISLDGGGKVTKVLLLEVEPATLEHKSIVQAIKGARFNLPVSERKNGIEDFLFNFSFNFIEEQLNTGLAQNSPGNPHVKGSLSHRKDSKI
jgi:hypothetical protein